MYLLLTEMLKIYIHLTTGYEFLILLSSVLYLEKNQTPLFSHRISFLITVCGRVIWAVWTSDLSVEGT